MAAIHSHAHAHPHPSPMDQGRVFAVAVGLNLIYVAAEAAWGVAANSLALLADAGHNLGDVLALALAWAAAHMARRRPSHRYTYGLGSASILAALANAGMLLLITGGIGWAAILRLIHPAPSGGLTVMAVAAAGVAVNGVSAWMFASGRKGEVNLRAAFSHMAADALVAAGVVVAGGLILLTGWQWLDPAAGLIVGGVIVVGTWSLLRESFDLAMQAVPAGVDRAAVETYLASLPGVAEVHDLHIWGMSTTETALTAHLVRPDGKVDDAVIHEICHELKSRFFIHHATLQTETGAHEHPCHLADETVV